MYLALLAYFCVTFVAVHFHCIHSDFLMTKSDMLSIRTMYLGDYIQIKANNIHRTNWHHSSIDADGDDWWVKKHERFRLRLGDIQFKLNEEIGCADELTALLYQHNKFITLAISKRKTVFDSHCSKFNVNKQRTKDAKRVRIVFALIFCYFQSDNPFIHTIFLRINPFTFQFDNRIVPLHETHLLLTILTDYMNGIGGFFTLNWQK